jgi:hypothetical protein
MNNSWSYLSQKCACDVRHQRTRHTMVIFGQKNGPISWGSRIHFNWWQPVRFLDRYINWWARGALPVLPQPQLQGASGTVIAARFELSVSHSLFEFLCRFYTFRAFQDAPPCTCYVFYVGIEIMYIMFRKERIKCFQIFFCPSTYIFSYVILVLIPT